MTIKKNNLLTSWLKSVHPQVWILAIGRLLSALGSGLTLFYATIFFVNRVGLSATSVGFALGSASITGIAGRLLGGYLADSAWGRRRTLLLSTIIAAVGAAMLGITNDFSALVAANLVKGFGVGLYWPATEALITDLTPMHQRREAFALTRLADNIGLGMGIIVAGWLVAQTENYRLLFVVDAISFVILFAVIYVAITETRQAVIADRQNTPFLQSWKQAFSDRSLQIYAVVNIIFTTYIAQLHSTMPLFFNNFISVGVTARGFSETTISSLFAWHLILTILCQIPMVKGLQKYSHTKALKISAGLWGMGFVVTWICGISESNTLLWAICALGIFALAIVSYTPSASSLVADLAPESQRGVYLSINSLCWAVGYFIGPALGGWALDRTPAIVNNFWLGFGLSIAIAILILHHLQGVLRERV
ncbi:MAG: MFS transporter [Richelia sp.]|nr:MFS transporter [Richelia sp.]